MSRKDLQSENVILPLRPFGAESLSKPYDYQKLRDAELKALKTRGVYLFPASIKEVGGNKWGYIDAKGEFVLPPIYEHAGDFQDNGLAIVRLKNLSGVIDSKGYFIVKPKYETINPFSEGRATVIDNQGFRVIDESGKEITSKAYSFIGDYKDGRALIADKNDHDQYLYGYLNRRGKEVLPLEYESASDFQDEKAIVKLKDGTYALISLTGKVIKNYPYSFVGNIGDGLLAFQEDPEGKFGYMDEQGNIIIKPQFTEAQAFINGRAIVNTAEDYKGQYGLIDQKGHFIIKPHYQSPFNLGESKIALGKSVIPEKPFYGSLYALADSEGHILTGFIFNGISKFNEGMASAYNDQFTFFIDTSGKRISSLPTVPGSGELHVDKTLIKAEVDFRLQYYNKNNQLVWKQDQKIPLKNSSYIVIENKYKPNKDYLVYFPQVSGGSNVEIQRKINLFLKEFSGIKTVSSNKQLDSSYTGDFDVPYFQKDLLVIEKTGYDYPFGAAHGIPLRRYAHINLKTGTIYQLKDLFKPGSQYVKMISGMIASRIKNKSYVFKDRYTGIRPDQPFFIDHNGLNIYFNPYEIAPYVAGFPTFEIPFEEVKSLIDDEGDFWRSFH
ncbi:MAG: WG repeat-containing protein [Bacillota bacterium]|nr:WG repeat-containing protein [Bacillota bacterium]